MSLIQSIQHNDFAEVGRVPKKNKDVEGKKTSQIGVKLASIIYDLQWMFAMSNLGASLIGISHNSPTIAGSMALEKWEEGLFVSYIEKLAKVA